MPALTVFTRSDGALTRRYCATLTQVSPLGGIAAPLFRALKASSRAKAYHGVSKRGVRYRDLAYTRKQWALGELCKALGADGTMRYGWGIDPAHAMFRHVLYIETPEGQVSFHSPERGKGPDFPDPWDGQHASQARILALCDSIHVRLAETYPAFG
jgi:hypothetical protein